MNSYFKMIADSIWLKQLPEKPTVTRRVTDEETKELIALMDNIPNAKLVAAVYQKMMKSGALDQRFKSADPGRRWLELEQMVLNRDERRRGNRRKIIWMLAVFTLMGIASYLGGVYLLTKAKYLGVQVVR
ncbi:MAG: hypothetical protein J7623_25240 [Chitinophaga sp.]|uniref:hypothetical protein n=1 Tax=Chitinophaga sp. TaxID=1869181 RepID=UPI001B1C0A46|nr:hypothetical protein [Chitinophaga sp.]MBO9731972.1 hypothetical protein [Chitinophaga sp.]